jgi:hypothetical protein
MSASSVLGSIACLVGDRGALHGARGFLLDMCVFYEPPHSNAVPWLTPFF